MLTRFKSLIRNYLWRLLREDPIARWRRLGAQIGDGVFVGFDAAIDEGFAPLLRIEDGVVLSARTLILLHDSAFNNVTGAPIKVGPVTIKRNAYVGANITVLCGVTIGHDAIVGAGALVAKDIPDGMVAFGCPATVRGSVTEFLDHYREAMGRPGPCRSWDIPAWRDRAHRMSPEEINESYRSFMQGFAVKDQGDRSCS